MLLATDGYTAQKRASFLYRYVPWEATHLSVDLPTSMHIQSTLTGLNWLSWNTFVIGDKRAGGIDKELEGRKRAWIWTKCTRNI